MDIKYRKKTLAFMLALCLTMGFLANAFSNIVLATDEPDLSPLDENGDLNEISFERITPEQEAEGLEEDELYAEEEQLQEQFNDEEIFKGLPENFEGENVQELEESRGTPSYVLTTPSGDQEYTNSIADRTELCNKIRDLNNQPPGQYTLTLYDDITFNDNNTKNSGWYIEGEVQLTVTSAENPENKKYAIKYNHPWSADFYITLRGNTKTSFSNVILDGEGKHKGIQVIDEATLNLDNVELRNFVYLKREQHPVISGGTALYASHKSIVNITNSSFHDNYINYPEERLGVTRGGAALAIDCASTVTLSNCEIYNNYASDDSKTSYGGAIVAQHNAKLNITNCNIHNNHTPGWGGAIYITKPNAYAVTSYPYTGTVLTIENSTIKHNYTGVGGGAIYSRGALNTINIINTNFSDNNSGVYGGAIFSYIPLCISGSTFENNHADASQPNTEAYGGAIYLTQKPANEEIGTLTINSSTFQQNTSTHYGGAVYLNRGPLTVNNSTFKDNSCPKYGGGIFITENAKCDLESNSKFINNIVDEDGGAIYVEPYDYAPTADSTIAYRNLRSDGSVIFTDNRAGSFSDPPINYQEFDWLKFSRNSFDDTEGQKKYSLLNNYDVNYKKIQPCTIRFIAMEGGHLETSDSLNTMSCDLATVPQGTSWAALADSLMSRGVMIPKPIPDENFVFSGFTPLLPSALASENYESGDYGEFITQDWTFIAKFSREPEPSITPEPEPSITPEPQPSATQATRTSITQEPQPPTAPSEIREIAKELPRTGEVRNVSGFGITLLSTGILLATVGVVSRKQR